MFKKITKYTLGIIIIIAGLSQIFTGSVLGGIFILLSGFFILPPIADGMRAEMKKQQSEEDLKNKKLNQVGRMLGRVLIVGLFFIGVFLSNPSEDNTQKEVSAQENTITYNVIEVLRHERQEVPVAPSEHIDLLIETSSYNKKNLEDIAFKLKNEYADFTPNNCNLSLWDNRKAYELEKQRQDYEDKIYSEASKSKNPKSAYKKAEKLIKAWDKEHYTFIADHLPASISLGNVFEYYSLKDDYYTEIGGTNKKENNVEKKNDKKTSSEDKIVFNANGENVGTKHKENDFNSVMGDEDFWNTYDPEVKKRIYEMIISRDCQRLQNEFDVAADRMEVKQSAGVSAYRELKLIGFIESKMREINCY